jgi:hypothetical protein
MPRAVDCRRGSRRCVPAAGVGETLDVQPTVLVELGETAQLETGGGAVAIDVTVACPVGTTGLQSRVNVSQQGRVSGNGVYTPGLRRDAAHVQGPGRGVEWHISDGDRPGTDLR